MSLEKEAYQEAIKEAAEPIFEDIPEPAPGVRVSDLIPDMSFILSETGPGPIENYVDHPLNFKGSRGVAQIIRGATGMAGTLNYAIIDIGLGLVQVTKEGKGVEKAVTDTE